jgi:hypothetical protein
LQSKQETEKQLSDATSQVEYLKHCNMQLSRKMEELHNEFVKNREYYNHLLNSIREQHMDQLQQQENHYEAVITSLKEKLQVQNSLQNSRLPALDSQRHMFSQKLQMQGIKPCNRDMANVERTSNPVATLLHYQHELSTSSNANKENPGTENNLPFPADEISFSTLHEVKRGPMRNVTFEQNKVMSFEKQNSRQSFARTAGGRKGLMEKLKKIRSPRLDIPVD